MKHQHDKSSTIKESEYDDRTHVLTVTFESGGSYQYHDVPAATDVEFRNASSPGKFFFHNIRGKFKTVKL